MNIVWLTPEVPYPPIGGRSGVYNRIVQLCKFNNIFLFSIAYNSDEKDNTKEMEKYCKRVNFYDRSENRFNTLLKSMKYPYSVASRFRKDICRDIEKVIIENDINLIIVDFPNMAKNIENIAKKYPKIVITLNEHNVEYVRMREMKNVHSISVLKRMAYWMESFRLESYERKLYKSGILAGITFFSEDDKIFFEKKIETKNAILRTIPLGANDCNETPSGDNKKTLLFVGRLDHIAIPNVEAITWFVKEVWPHILEAVPEAQLIIAGSNPDDKVFNLKGNHITIIPNFEKMKDVYDLTDIVILPLLSGGGVKGKLLEAIAFRKHIITTMHGIEGTLFENKRHINLCDTASEFSKACIDVLQNPTQFKKQEEDAYKLFCEKYEWGAIGMQYMDYLESIGKIYDR